MLADEECEWVIVTGGGKGASDKGQGQRERVGGREQGRNGIRIPQ